MKPDHNQIDLYLQLMNKLKLDKEYIKALGNYLYYFKSGKQIKVLDLCGGYGSLMLGHNNKKIR